MAKVVVCETLLKPQEIPIPSSVGDGTYYTVIARTIYNDPVCECKGYEFRGTCKHIAMVEEAMCDYHRPPTQGDLADENNLGRCPICRNKLILFELDPEWDDEKSIDGSYSEST